MAVEILENKEGNQAVLFCNTTDWAFGPLISDYNENKFYYLAGDVAKKFLKWLYPTDPRELKDNELGSKYLDFLSNFEKIIDEIESPPF